MFSKEESAQLRKEFWTSFGKSFPRKWLLYNTKIKDFSFKFVADKKQALVCLDIESFDRTKNELLYGQILELQNILVEDFLPDVIFDEVYILETGKIIHRVYVKFNGDFNIHDKNTWQACYEFFKSFIFGFKEIINGFFNCIF